jgi:hypothetical protein
MARRDPAKKSCAVARRMPRRTILSILWNPLMSAWRRLKKMRTGRERKNHLRCEDQAESCTSFSEMIPERPSKIPVPTRELQRPSRKAELMSSWTFLGEPSAL